MYDICLASYTNSLHLPEECSHGRNIPKARRAYIMITNFYAISRLQEVIFPHHGLMGSFRVPR